MLKTKIKEFHMVYNGHNDKTMTPLTACGKSRICITCAAVARTKVLIFLVLLMTESGEQPWVTSLRANMTCKLRVG